MYTNGLPNRNVYTLHISSTTGNNESHSVQSKCCDNSIIVANITENFDLFPDLVENRLICKDAMIVGVVCDNMLDMIRGLVQEYAIKTGMPMISAATVYKENFKYMIAVNENGDITSLYSND